MSGEKWSTPRRDCEETQMSSRLETAGVTRVIEPLNGRALSLFVSSGKTKRTRENALDKKKSSYY